ncbi:MAG TPA: hypothetical protein VML55_02695 [Planctomycetaceae bacterium]|nr:hypothetical protein [Planctomycetaceae bacterium]
MKLTNRIKDLWSTGTRQATSLTGRTQRSEDNRGGGWTNWLEKQLADHPTWTLGIGLAVGVTIGWLIKRR